MTRRLAFAVVSALAVVGSATAGTAAAQPAGTQVQMKEFAFMPATVTVKAGQAVTWTYNESATDPVPNCESVIFQVGPVKCPGHSTTAVDKGPDGKPLWDSGVHRADGFPFSFTFTKPGTYHYICIIHGGANKNNPVTNMEGDVVVQAAAAAAPAPPAPPASPGGGGSGGGNASVQGGSASQGQQGGLSTTGPPFAAAWGLAALGGAALLRRRRRR